MTVRKLSKNNSHDLLSATSDSSHWEIISVQDGVLNPDEYAGYIAASLIPGLNDLDWEVIYTAVNEAVEKTEQGGSNPESVLVFEILGYAGSPLLAVIELYGYVPTNLTENQGYWTGVRAHLFSQKTFTEGLTVKDACDSPSTTR